MAKQIAKVTVTGIFEFTFDDEDPKYIEALKGYAEYGMSGADEEDMIKHIAYNLARSEDASQFIDCVGLISKQDRDFNKEEEAYSGIEVDDDDPCWEIDVWFKEVP